MLVYIASLFLTSLIGFVINIGLFVRFASFKVKPFKSFHKLCLAKTVPNILISAIFAFWAVPMSFLGIHDIPRLQNIIFSQILGGFAYTFGPILQVCMAFNRFVVLFFPFGRKKFDSFPVTNTAIFVSVILANTSVYASILTDCYFYYDAELIFFLPELEECAHAMDTSMFALICTLSLTANGVNLTILLKLLKDKMGGISEHQKSKRRKRSVAMFTQSAIQDLLQLVDITNYKFVSQLDDGPTWTFLFCCLSFAMVYALDGAVMLYFHTDFLRSKVQPKSNVHQVTPVQSSMRSKSLTGF